MGLFEVVVPFGFHSQRTEAFTAFPNFTPFLFTKPPVETFGLAVATADLVVATVGIEIFVFGAHFWL